MEHPERPASAGSSSGLRLLHRDIGVVQLQGSTRSDLVGLLRPSRLHSEAGAPPNAMSGHGFSLSEEQLETVLTLVYRPVAEVAPANFEVPKEPWSVYGFVVGYGSGADRHLDLHVDDSDLTLNLCLEGECEGAELVFEGRRCELHRHLPTRDEERFVYRHTPGAVVVHQGDHRHRVSPWRSGWRNNLLLWIRRSAPNARSGAGFRAIVCTPGCTAIPAPAATD